MNSIQDSNNYKYSTEYIARTIIDLLELDMRKVSYPKLCAMSQDDFGKSLYFLSIDALKQLFHEIPQIIQEKHLQGELMEDMIRKQTKIQYEMMRRGYLTNKDNADFNKWAFAKKVKRLFTANKYEKVK